MAVKADIVDFLASDKELVRVAFDLAVAVKPGRISVVDVKEGLKKTIR